MNWRSELYASNSKFQNVWGPTVVLEGVWVVCPVVRSRFFLMHLLPQV